MIESTLNCENLLELGIKRRFFDHFAKLTQNFRWSR